MSMGLKQVLLSGFRSYGASTNPVKLGDLNIIIGPNGAGKSNFISFFEMIANICSDGFGDYVARNGYAKSLMYARKNRIDQMECRLLFGGDDGTEDEYGLVIKQGVDGRLFISKESIKYYSGGHAQPYEQEFTVSGTKSALLGENGDDTMRVILRILRGCRVYHFNDTSMNARMRMPGYVQDDRYLRSDGGNLAAYLYRLQSSESTIKYYNRIIDIVREVFPRFDRFDLHPRSRDGEDESISLNWRERGCEDVFGPHMLSDGTLRFIALATLLLRPESEKTGLIILDEPEIGLHPFAVRVLAELLRMASKESQIIVATQSKELLNAVDPGDVIVAEFDPVRESSVLKRLKEEELTDWLEEYSLSELWEKNIIGGNA